MVIWNTGISLVSTRNTSYVVSATDPPLRREMHGMKILLNRLTHYNRRRNFYR